jgi:AbrB family looped-hinge helix DNA binding protein
LTLPKEVRERLGLRAGDRLRIEVEGETVLLRAERGRTLEELKGSLPARRPYPGKAAERVAAREAVARRLVGGEAEGPV